MQMRWSFIIPATVVVGGIFLAGMLWGDTASAIDFPSIGNWILLWVAQALFAIATLCIGITVWALKFFIVLAGYNGFSTAPVVDLGWTLIRDIANMFFIIALLVIAFATILGQENYALKKTLGKLLLMAIFINFSKLITQLVIDVAHVVTMTFLNALSAVAGGNLIQMLKFNDIMSIKPEIASQEGFAVQLFGAAVMSVSMTWIALCMLAAYFIVMLYRMVTLWILIILSPLAFAASALPATAKFFGEWSKQFTNNVISAPIMVFFMWLAFATMSDAATLLQVTEGNSMSTETEQLLGGSGGEEYSVSLSRGSTWNNLAGFAIAIGFLFAGVQQVSNLGVGGKGALDKAMSVGKAGAMILTGAAAAKWGAQQGWKRTKQGAYMAGSGVDTVMRKLPLGGGSVYRAFADSGARWDAATQRTEEAMKIKKEKSALQGGLLTNALGVSDKTMADVTNQRDNTKRSVESRRNTVQSELKSNQINAEEGKLDAMYQEALQNESTKQGRPLTETEQENIRMNLIEQNRGKFEFLSSQADAVKAKRTSGKAQGGEDRTMAMLRDTDRVLQGGQKKYRREFEDKNRREDMEDYARMDSGERGDAIVQNGVELRKLQTKKSTTGLSDKEKTAFKQAQAKMDLLLQSALENGEGEYLKHHLAAIAGAVGDSSDKSDWDSLVDDATGVEQVMLAIQTGKTKADLNTKINRMLTTNELRKDAGPAADVRFRNQAVAAQKNVEQTGAIQWSGLSQKGVDYIGQEVWAYSGSVNSGKPVVTGEIGTGKVGRSGVDIKDSKIKSAGSKVTVRNMKSGAAAVTRDTAGRATAFISDEAKQAVSELQNANAGTINALNKEILYALGGRTSTGESSGGFGFNSSTKTLKFAGSSIKDESEKIYNQLYNEYTTANSNPRLGPSNPETLKRLETLRSYARGITGDPTYDPTAGILNFTT